MPNVGAEYMASTTAIYGSDKTFEIFSKIGKVIKVNSEKELDIATAIAGSGPAFLALVAEAISDGGVLCGLNRELSYELTAGLFKSFASIEKKPSEIKDSVMSPAGTTASGYESLEEGNVRNSFIKAIKSAYEKSQKI
jgi:pyrroline-5-carboxylate reductase